MFEKMIMKLRELLLKRKREILNQVAHLERGRKAQDEHVIERGDAAQKEDLVRLLDHLIERGNKEVREINLALERIAESKYGICEICEKRIESKRLKVLPSTRLCCKCAQNYEKVHNFRQHLRDEIIDDEQLEEYRNLLNEDLITEITMPHNNYT